MAQTYECGTCNVISDTPEALCHPTPTALRCDYGRDLAEQRNHMCKPTRNRVEEVCDLCGRPTLQDYLVCLPTSIKD